MRTKKLLLGILLALIISNAHSQNFRSLEVLLAKKLNNNNREDGRWVFYTANANTKKIEKPLVKAVLPDFDFYSVQLTNYLGYHVNQGTCLILHDSLQSKIVLVEPLWYGGVSSSLIKLIIGKSFNSKEALLGFMDELNQLMQVGSIYKSRLTSYTDSLVSFDLGYKPGDSYSTQNTTLSYNKDGVWRELKWEIDNLQIKRLRSINPVTNDEEVIE